MSDRYEYTVILVVKVMDEDRPWDDAAEALRRRVARLKGVTNAQVDSAPDPDDDPAGGGAYGG